MTSAKGKAAQLARRRRKAAEKRAVDAWRRAYLAESPICEIGPVLSAAGRPEAKNCRGQARELHERIRRSGWAEGVTEPSNIFRTCRPCHTFTELEPLVSYELGLLGHSWERERWI